MRVFVRVKANAKVAAVERIDGSHFKVSVKEPARDGRANSAVQEALAEYFDVPVSLVRLVSGFAARQKLFEVG